MAKLPKEPSQSEITPEPPRIGSRICGALITWLSRTIASRLPTFWVVASPNRLPPTASNRKETTGSFCWNVGCESTRFSPLTTTRRRTAILVSAPCVWWRSSSGSADVSGASAAFGVAFGFCF